MTSNFWHASPTYTRGTAAQRGRTCWDTARRLKHACASTGTSSTPTLPRCRNAAGTAASAPCTPTSPLPASQPPPHTRVYKTGFARDKVHFSSFGALEAPELAAQRLLPSGSSNSQSTGQLLGTARISPPKLRALHSLRGMGSHGQTPQMRMRAVRVCGTPLPLLSPWACTQWAPAAPGSPPAPCSTTSDCWTAAGSGCCSAACG